MYQQTQAFPDGDFFRFCCSALTGSLWGQTGGGKEPRLLPWALWRKGDVSICPAPANRICIQAFCRRGYWIEFGDAWSTEATGDGGADQKTPSNNRATHSLPHRSRRSHQTCALGHIPSHTQTSNSRMLLNGDISALIWDICLGKWVGGRFYY